MAKKTQYGLGHTRITVPGRPDLTNKTAVVMVGDKTLEEALEEGGGGTSNYPDLENKPSINGVELDGDMTSEDLGVYSKPSGGIPESDLSSDVQQSLQKHFKGWYASSSNLPSTPVVGDYAYVKGAESTDPAAIYECTTNGSWSDSGRSADTSNVQTFASGEEVNEVHIVDGLTDGGRGDVLGVLYGKENVLPLVNSVRIIQDEQLYISDAQGNYIAKFDSEGLQCIGVRTPSIIKNDWFNKRIAFYGDSVVAQCNGDFQAPYNETAINNKWGIAIANYFQFSEAFGRGIGSQGYKWQTAAGNGGSVSWLTPTGVLINRLDSFNYDNWDGTTYPSGVTAEMEQQGTAVRVRGCLSSWLRITNMFPESIKNDIDVILVMAHNDGYDATDWAFVAEDTTDTEWAASGNDYYGKIGGDYNITTLKGAIASTIMKLQFWMPNAVIVLLSGISGNGTSGELNNNINSNGLMNIAQSVRDMSKITSIPCIDTFASDGINGWNRTTYISDTIHPNYSGNRMFSRSVIGGLKSILPKANN